MLGVIFLAQRVHTTTHNRALTAITHIVALCMVVRFTIGLAFLLKERAPIEGAAAVAACKALLMPLLVQSIDDLARCRLATARALGCECALVAVLAIGHAVLLKEAAAREGIAAAVAHKAVDVPFLVHGCDTTIRDGLATEAAHGAIDVAVALFTIGQPINLIEARCAQGVLTRRTHKVVGMELFAQRLNAFSQNGFLAPSTVASAGTDTIVDTAHLIAQGAEKIIDVIARRSRRFGGGGGLRPGGGRGTTQASHE